MRRRCIVYRCYPLCHGLLSDLQPTHISHFSLYSTKSSLFHAHSIYRPPHSLIFCPLISAKMGIAASLFKQSFFLPVPTFTEKNLHSQAGKVRIGPLAWR